MLEDKLAGVLCRQSKPNPKRSRPTSQLLRQLLYLAQRYHLRAHNAVAIRMVPISQPQNTYPRGMIAPGRQQQAILRLQITGSLARQSSRPQTGMQVAMNNGSWIIQFDVMQHEPRTKL